MAEMKVQDVFDAIGGNLDELNAKIEEAAKSVDSIRPKYVVTDFGLPPATQFAALAVGEMASFITETESVPGGPWSGSSIWGYVARTHAEYYFMFAARVNHNQVAYRSSNTAGAGTWKPWVIDDGTGVAGSAKKLVAGRTVQTDLASTGAPAFDGTANISPGVTGVLPTARGGTGNSSGNAATATRLATGRSFSISGGATAAVKSFDGSGAVDLAVTGLDVSKANAGTLPVGRGGTGVATLASGQVLVGNGAGAVATRAIATAPASGSSALLTAGGAYTALANKANAGPFEYVYLPLSISDGNEDYCRLYQNENDEVFLQLNVAKKTFWANEDKICDLPSAFHPDFWLIGFALVYDNTSASTTGVIVAKNNALYLRDAGQGFKGKILQGIFKYRVAR